MFLENAELKSFVAKFSFDGGEEFRGFTVSDFTVAKTIFEISEVSVGETSVGVAGFACDGYRISVIFEGGIKAFTLEVEVLPGKEVSDAFLASEFSAVSRLVASAESLESLEDLLIEEGFESEEV